MNGATDSCIFQSRALFEFAMHYTKKTTINKQILCRFQKNFLRTRKLKLTFFFFRCFAPCLAFLWAEKLSCSVVLPPKERTNVHRTAFFFTPVISHCLKSQLSKKYGEKTLLGAAKSLEVTFPRVSRRGCHFANVGDVIIYPDLVVARTDFKSISACPDQQAYTAKEQEF